MSGLTRNKCQHQRRVLFARDPHCHWCGVVTVEPSATHNKDPRMATLDHIRSRLQCATKEEYRSDKNKVLACLKCNGERDRALWLSTRPWIAEAQKHAGSSRVWHAKPVDIFAAPSWEAFG